MVGRDLSAAPGGPVQWPAGIFAGGTSSCGEEHIVPRAHGEVAFSADELERELCRILLGYLGEKKKR